MSQADLQAAQIRPPLSIREPTDSHSQDHRLNCLAWHFLKTRSREAITAWLETRDPAEQWDMRQRLNRLREEVKNEEGRS